MIIVWSFILKNYLHINKNYYTISVDKRININIMQNILVIINSEQYKGYSVSAQSLVSTLKDTEKTIIDLAEYDVEYVKSKIQCILSKSREQLKIISAGDMGINVFNSLLEGGIIKVMQPRIQFILSSDKFYSIPLQMKEITLIMPSFAIKKFKEENKHVRITACPADFVATPSMDDIKAKASTFERDNTSLIGTIRSITDTANTFMFVGGRVSIGNGSWKENTPEIFETAAREYMQRIKDSNGLVIFHGLRSFTNSKNENDFSAVEKFYQTVKSLLTNGQKIIFLTKLDSGKNEDGIYKRMPIVKIFEKTKGQISEHTMDITVSSSANDYYWALNEAVLAKKNMLATGEQINFISEATKIRAPLSDIIFYNWALTVESNIETQQDIKKHYEQTGKLPFDATEAFARLLDREKQAKSLQQK